MDSKVYKRCELIIRQFMELDNPAPELTDKFHEWLLNGHYCREKDAIVRSLFYEAIGDGSTVSGHYDVGLTPEKTAIEECLL